MKKFIRFMRGALIVILVLVAIHQIASMILSRRVASKLAEIKAQGDPVSMAELGKIDIPDSENGATIYMQIFKEMGSAILSTNGVPHHSGLDGTRNIDYMEFFIGKKPTPEMWVKGKKSMATYQHALDLVDDASSRQRCQFKTNWKDGAGSVFPHYGILRELSRMLMLDAQISAREGDMNKAVKRVGQIFKISKSIEGDPILLSLLTQMQVIRIGLKSINAIQQYGTINGAHIKYLDGILTRLDPDRSYLLAMKGERTQAIHEYNRLLNINRLPNMPWYARIISPILRPAIYADELINLDYWEKKLEMAKFPYIETPESRISNREKNKVTKYAIWSRTIVSVYSKSVLTRDFMISSIRSARAYLGLIAYKEKFGEYPQSLDELRSKLGWKVDVDPLTSKDFHYKRQGAGFLLYGVGPNLRDDGGVFRRKKVTDLPSDEYDDIVWQLAR